MRTAQPESDVGIEYPRRIMTRSRVSTRSSPVPSICTGSCGRVLRAGSCQDLKGFTSVAVTLTAGPDDEV